MPLSDVNLNLEDRQRTVWPAAFDTHGADLGLLADQQVEAWRSVLPSTAMTCSRPVRYCRIHAPHSRLNMIGSKGSNTRRIVVSDGIAAGVCKPPEQNRPEVLAYRGRG